MSNELTIKDLQVKDLLVSIDLETTGLDPYLHDMWEIAVVPFELNEYKTSAKVLPCTFKARMRPQNPMSMQPKALEVGGVTKEELMAIPTNLFQILNSFYEWKLEMYPEYRFIPVGHNYVSFDKQFLIAKMNSFNYDQNFNHHSLDTKVIVKWLQSMGYSLGEKLSLQGLKKFFNLPSRTAHTSEGDALTCIDLLCALNKLVKGDL
jgi:DNA polymerase III epsilon subunit-like protein